MHSSIALAGLGAIHATPMEPWQAMRICSSPMRKKPTHTDDSRSAARKAGLRYVSDTALAGITRHGRPGHFTYKSPRGGVLRDSQTLKRIAKLAIPPAWRQVWIAPIDNAHLAATGLDVKGRKQYRYHTGFAAVRDRAKYDHLASFAARLPALRKRLAADLRRPGLPREKVIAVVITLLEETLIRIGNEAYARDNASFGLTTLRNKHVKIRGGELRFTFRGKSGKDWSLKLHDARVAKVVRGCQELPGQHLFEYRDEDGKPHSITSGDVNRYLHEACGDDVSAKDFRTWAGTVEAALAFDALEDKYPSKKNVKAVVSQVADRLGNTVAVCRKCYIHPAVFEAFERGRLKLKARNNHRVTGLSAAEKSVLTLLKG
jgi:DNA topoisomerase-1